MHLSKFIGLLVLFLLVLLTCSCGIANDKETISDLAYTRVNFTNLVYIKEEDQYVPFVVLSDNYCGNTLLVRRDVISEHRRLNDYSSYYKDSEMDRFLNNEYLMRLPEIEPYIASSNIVITRDDALGLSKTDTETISRKVFLLSCSELGIDDSPNMAIEGETLNFFCNEENRKVYLDGENSSWWLRTPNTYYLSCTYVIGDNNKIGSTNSYDNNGVRPAFCISGNVKIELKRGIIENEQVYVLSTN